MTEFHASLPELFVSIALIIVGLLSFFVCGKLLNAKEFSDEDN